MSNGSQSEALKFELERREQGSWGTMRIVFYIIILATVVFIALGEPGLIGNFEAILGAIAGLGALIPLASSMLAGGKGK